MVWIYGRFFGSGCGFKWIDFFLVYFFLFLNVFELLKKNLFEVFDLEICDEWFEKMVWMKVWFF